MITADITAIIPTYRRPKLLRRAVTSVLNQAAVSLSVRVFDNASGDETGAVMADLAKGESRLSYHCHRQNIGAAANFEYGLRSVDTPFFSIFSDDDYLLPGFYQQALEDLAKHPNAMFWAGMTLNVDEQGNIWDARINQWTREGLYLPADGMMAMMNGLAPSWNGILFRREILDFMGFPDKEALGPSDLDFVLRAAASYPFFLRKHPSAVFTLNAASFSATEPLSSFWPGWKKMFRNIECSESLSDFAKQAALVALHKDAKRMLFRRGANVLSFGRYDFARGAAGALQMDYGQLWRPMLLRAIATACEQNPWFQRIYTRYYRMVENRLVNDRRELQKRFGHLVRDVR
ncbi:hypothetical protein HDE78_001032 [Rhodanobacter sp. K2T2]|uniref:glycosyltransferase n=1 Tax=Rhodanobacter sp. K2T2 TaxID=2723085 RepID=UPI0015C90F81|nr:hypothetical protein [Rhodanobacter sp. K2T2]